VPTLGTTGLPQADAQDDFLRARRRRAMARLRRLWERDVDAILPFDEVVAALGRTGQVDLGLQVVDLDTIVGSVDRPRGFDRRFRPTSSDVRTRWERIATAMRRGEPLPPVLLYRVGEVHFVRDGHHRVSVARALGHRTIDARVTEVRTRVGAARTLTLADLPHKGQERLFAERVPLDPSVRGAVRPSDPDRFGDLAEGVEAWGFRTAQSERRLLDRRETATRWYAEEFAPAVALLREAGEIRAGETDADAYLRAGGERYRTEAVRSTSG
jgi:hypothetical protein